MELHREIDQQDQTFLLCIQADEKALPINLKFLDSVENINGYVITRLFVSEINSVYYLVLLLINIIFFLE